MIARVSPLAASWATHTVVNGMGRLAQKFWLANNLIAQIPGKAEAAREHSEAWALKGMACCCTPKAPSAGTRNFVAPLLAGRRRDGARGARSVAAARDADFQVLGRAGRLEARLHSAMSSRRLPRNAAYVERRLEIGSAGETSGLTRCRSVSTGSIDTLLARDAGRLGIDASTARLPFADRQTAVIDELRSRELGAVISADRRRRPTSTSSCASSRRRLRDNAGLDAESRKRLKSLNEICSARVQPARALRLQPARRSRRRSSPSISSASATTIARAR